MKAQTVHKNQKAQEYLVVGAVITAAGVMFMAGSLQLTHDAFLYTRGMAILLAIVGVLLMGAGLGMRPKLPSAARTAKPAVRKKRA